MSNVSKLRGWVDTGVVTEKLINAFLVRQKRLRIFADRYRHSRIRQKCADRANAWYGGKQHFADRLVRTVGQFSDYLQNIDEGTQKEILAQAEKIQRREFDILGSGPLVLDQIDWHTDYKTGFRWPPGTYFVDYSQVNLSDSADVKFPRELCRCHHFLILGQAYLISRDERHAQEFVRQVTDWIETNPLMKSINWGCTMDVAIRAVNWVWALAMFIESKALDEPALRKIVVSLYEHGYFIYRNPEKAPSNNHNHYISDLVGQIYLGSLFEHGPEASIWLNKGRDELFREMRSQILPSGPTYERSTNYHRLVLELLSSAIFLLRRTGQEIPTDIWYRLEQMYNFVLYYLKPDGLAPVVGDQDDGRAHPFGIQRNIDHRYLLAIAAAAFENQKYKIKTVTYNPDCFFLLGPESRSRFDLIGASDTDLTSNAFPDAGFYVLRDRDNYMFVNMSGKSRYPEVADGTHTHSDLLSFELAARGKTFLVDPGTYLYSADPAERMRFRSTQMHNTVTVDGHSQNELRESNLWDFERNAIPNVSSWKTDSAADHFSGSHSGYQRLPEPVTHQRDIFFDKGRGRWEITDSIVGTGTPPRGTLFPFRYRYRYRDRRWSSADGM